MPIVDKAIEAYIKTLSAPTDEPVLERMHQLAHEREFPIVGQEVGRLLYILCRVSGARSVLELGSGFGYSAYWFASALPPEGWVVCTDNDQANCDQAEELLAQAGLDDKVEYLVGDALALLEQVEGVFDIIFCDIDKQGYPSVVEPALARLRSGGLLICDNTLWYGRVADPEQDDPDTRGVRRFNQLVAAHPRLTSVNLPLRDGLTVALKG